MSITIYGIKTCDTCRKAQKALPSAAFRNIRDMPLSDAERAELIAEFGDALVNRASATWRGLSEHEKTQDTATLLAAHPTLMKRPVIQSGDKWYLGWKKEVQTALGVGD